MRNTMISQQPVRFKESRFGFPVAALLLLLTCLVAPLLTFASSPADAQSVRPVIIESVAKTDGSFELVNDTITPMVATIEPRSFTIDEDGKASFINLPAGLTVELSTRSVRVPPHQTRTVFYHAEATHYPAWFCIYSNFSGLRTAKGVALEIELPHTVYLSRGKGITQKDLKLEDLSLKDGWLFGRLVNIGQDVGRVQEMALFAADGSKSLGEGFPLLPGQSRRFRIAAHGGSPLRRLTLRIRDWHLDLELSHMQLESTDSAAPLSEQASVRNAGEGSAR